jgi:poly(A) polymerase
VLPKLLEILKTQARRRGQPIYLVGGPVRDRLLGRLCHDWDFACRDARAVAKALAKPLHATFIALDEENKIYRLVLPRAGERITIDIAELAGGSIAKDLARRDFTINAMAMEIGKSVIIDPFHGQRDLKRRCVRAVSRAAFTDDPVRLLRAFRFAAQLGFEIEPRTRRWIHAEVPVRRSRRLGVAAERLREELLRLLCSPEAGKMLPRMDQSGLLTALFPELEPCRRSAVRYYGRGGVLKHSLATVANLDWLLHQMTSSSRYKFLPPSIREKIWRYTQQTMGGFPKAAWLRLAGLLHDVGKPLTAKVIKGRLRFFGHEDVGAGMALRMAQTLRCSRQESQGLAVWVRHHMRLGNLAAASKLTEKALARYFRDLGEDGVGMVLVSLADHYDYLAPSKWGKGLDPVEKTAARLLSSYYVRRETILPPKLVDGHLLMKALKLAPGPIIGKLLEAIQDAQSEGDVKTVSEAVAYAKVCLAKQRFKKK